MRNNFSILKISGFPRVNFQTTEFPIQIPHMIDKVGFPNIWASLEENV